MRRNHEKVYIYGKHALMEALLAAPHVVKKVFLSREMMGDKELKHLLAKNNIPSALLKNQEERAVGEDAAHQGVIASADTSRLLIDFHEFAERLAPSEATLLVLLHELTDPHNVGAIIRSAAAFGASGVLIPSHHQAPITGAVVKASVGMVFRVPLVAIGNINQTIDVLKEKGFKSYALAMNGAKTVAEEKFDAPTLVVVGNEGKGIRQKTIERADVTLRIPMHPRTESLNASVSAAIVLYAWSAAHKSALKSS
jgi:23S rRNA (guanosine2251-2'-O)-methyltransferase